MFVQSRSVSKKPSVIAAPIVVALAEMKKAGIFEAKSIAGISAVNFLQQSVAVLKGVGAGGAKALEARGIVTLNDLVANQPEMVVGLEPKVSLAAYKARTVMVEALERNGISVEVRPDMRITTMAIFTDPVTGLTYNR